MGGHQHDAQGAQPPPAAYSNRVTYGDDGYHADGYKVVIDPGKLHHSIQEFKKKLAGQNLAQLTQSLTDALGAKGAFGKIPNSSHASAEFQKFIQSHVEQMAQMHDGTLVEFIARVQAAADLGYQSDPATKQWAAWARRHMI